MRQGRAVAVGGGSAACVSQRLRAGTALSGLIAAGLVTLAAVPAHAQEILPTGGAVTHGAATISSDGASLLVQQSSPTAIVSWDSFSIGGGASAHFANGAGATLNRVTGNDPSTIAGTLSATGSLYLINPAGVTVGASGQVLTGGSFIASTHDLSDADFLAQRNMTFAGASKAGIVNHGTIRSAMGDVALIARRVENTGEIEALNGTAGLVAGYEILMRETSGADGKFAVRVGGSDTEVVNSGTIRAAEVELRANGGNVYALGINTRGVIKATGARKKGGRIFLTAEGGKVEAGGTLRAERRKTSGKVRGGEVVVRADTVKLSGRIDASGMNGGKGGTITAIARDGIFLTDTARFDASGSKGGFVETSGRSVSIASGARVDTRGSAGTAGNWLIDPTDFTISAGAGAHTASGIGADTLVANLATTNVELMTAATGGQDGDIFVNAAVSWNAATTLKLTAHDDIFINAAITGRNGGLTLAAAGEINTAAAGSVDVGTFRLEAGDWVQSGTLPAFAARDFQIAGGSFLRVLGGDGTSATPYRVTDVYGLQGMGSSPAHLAASWQLANDIDASGTANWNGGLGWKPVGGEGADFTGQLAGANRTISGLTVNRPTENYVGLFGRTRNATIENLAIDGASIRGNALVGALAGFALAEAGTSRIEGVAVSGAVSGAYRVGGLLGAQQGFSAGHAVIERAKADISVSGDFEVGGLVGSQWAYGFAAGAGSASIRQSTTSGLVTGNNYVGGLVGENRAGGSQEPGAVNVLASGSTASVRGANYVGGLVGRNNGDGATANITVSGSSASGDVLATGDQVGGLVGEHSGRNALITHSIATGNVIGRNQVGGLVGRASTSSWGGYVRIENSIASGNVSGVDAVGGLVGYSRAVYGLNNSIWYSYASGAISGTSNVGGILGHHDASGYYGTAGQIYYSAWDVEKSGVSQIAGPNSGVYLTGNQGLTTAAALQQASYQSMGWDFSSAGSWFMIDGATRPFLRSEWSSEITNARQLQLMAMDLSASYTLANDIDLGKALAQPGSLWGAAGFAPIGIDAAGNPLGGANDAGGFRGSLDGKGHVIAGLAIDRAGPRSGLFGHVGGSGNIVNLGLDGGSVRGGAFTGGLAGVSFGTIADSWTSLAVSGTSNVGGLVGYFGANAANTSEIRRGFSTGTVTATNSGTAGNVGGLVGRAAGGRITQSHSTSAVSSNRDAVGGLVGWLSNGANLYYSYSSGSVLGRSGVGGLIGKVDAGSTIEYAYSYANVASQAFSGGSGPAGVDVGGLVGNNAGSIDRTWSSGRVSGPTGTTGGLIGKNGGAVQRSYWDVQTSGQSVGIANGGGSAFGRTTAELMNPGTYAGWSVYTGSSDVPPPPAWWQIAGETRPFLVTEFSTSIRNAHQLQMMSRNLGGSYQLVADVALAGELARPEGMWSGRGFVPVGTIDQPFSGTFDGQGNTISGLRIDRILTNNVGLFGLARNVSIANVSLTDVFIKGYEATGSLVGYLQSSHGQSTVSAVNASGQVQGRSSFAGGLVGRSLADIGGVNQISEVKADVRVSGSQFTGGLVGINHGFGGAALVLRSQASGNINGGEFVGGLVGANVAANGPASLTDVAAYGSVLGTYGVGGLAGAHYAQSSSATIHRSYASGSVTLVGFSAERGGIVGYAANSELSSSFWNVETSGQSNAIGNNAAAAGAQGLTTAQIQDTEGFMALAGAQGWDFENVWAPSSAGYDPELYALSRVARVDFGSFTRQYGEPDPNLALATIFGGPRAYVFGPAGDSLAISGAPTTAASAYSPVGSYAVSGPAAAQSAQGRDYRLVSTGRMNVTPRWLQLDFSRQYDGTANADAASAWAWNVLDGDVVSLTGTGTLGGSQANNWYELVDRGTIAVGNGNYMLAPEQGWHGGYIAQRSVQLVGTRAYDGTANVAAADLSVANLVAGDTLTLTGSSTVSGAGVGTYGFNAAAFTIDNANYYIQGNATGSLTINPAMLTVTAQGQLKAYGDADQTLAYHASGFRGSDTEASVMSGSLVRDAGENVGDYRIRIGSLAAGANYAIDFSGADLSIGRATLEVTADANGKTYGDADLELSYVASGFRFADDASIISGAAMRDAGENVGSYAIWQGSLAAGGNYAIYFRPAEFTIDPATLSVAADPATKTEGAADPALSWRASGFRLGDSAAATLTGQVERAAGETAGTYAIGRGTLAAGSNYLMVFTGAGFIIVPRAVQTPAVVTTVPGQPASPAAGAIERNAPATVTPPTAGAFGATQECRTGGVLGPQCADVPHPDTLSMLN